MTSGGGRNNFDDYTIMHSVRVASLEPVKESFVSWLRGIVTLSTGFRRGKKKEKNCSPRRDEIFFFLQVLWFVFPYHAGAPARNNRTTIYYTLGSVDGKDARSSSSTSFSSIATETVGDLRFSRKDHYFDYCFDKTMLLPRAARNSWRQVNRCSVVSKVRSVLNSVKKRLFVRCLF